MLRLYSPPEELLGGRWVPPPVQKMAHEHLREGITR
jgi:hypothetical protein